MNICWLCSAGRQGMEEEEAVVGFVTQFQNVSPPPLEDKVNNGPQISSCLIVTLEMYTTRLTLCCGAQRWTFFVVLLSHKQQNPKPTGMTPYQEETQTTARHMPRSLPLTPAENMRSEPQIPPGLLLIA